MPNGIELIAQERERQTVDVDAAEICAEMAREMSMHAASCRTQEVFELGIIERYEGMADALREAERRIRATSTSERDKAIYVASRASLPERGAMWRKFRDEGVVITSSWIDEDGEGQSQNFGELWQRITEEIRSAVALVLYAEAGDFPLKGAFIEAGIALGMGKRVFICLPGVALDPRSARPVGSWINHPLVTRDNVIENAIKQAQNVRSRISAKED